MKGISVRSFYRMGSSRYGSAVSMAVAILLSGIRADGAVIRHEDVSSSDAAVFKEWSRYLEAGPNVWKDVLHPPVTQAVRSAIWEDVKTDPGGTEPMVAFLLWKQSIDPTRFAHYHPKLAPALEKILKATPSAPVAPQELAPPSSESSSTPATTVAPQGLNPPAPAPEPSTLLLALGLAGWSVWQVRRKKSNP
ncbi:MAG: PEP-CTERM sorting domain-containing protein [Isosphaeraceae bacterium]